MTIDVSKSTTYVVSGDNNPNELEVSKATKYLAMSPDNTTDKLMVSKATKYLAMSPDNTTDKLTVSKATKYIVMAPEPSISYYFTHFSEYTDDAQPSDWTERWVTTAGASNARADTTGIGDSHLEVKNSSASRYHLSWNKISADNYRDDVEVLIRAKQSAFDAGTGTQYATSIALRTSGASGTENAYVLAMHEDDTVLLYKLVAGTYTTLVTSTATSLGLPADLNDIEDLFFWMRFRVNGTDLKAKVWMDTDPEPGSWQITTTDSALTGVGNIGIANIGTVAYCKYDFMSVATYGGTAPMPTIYETDFSEYTVDVAPSDWSEIWHTTSGAITAKSGSANSDLGSAYLELSKSSDNRYCATWDDVDIDPIRVDTEVLVRVTQDIFSIATSWATGIVIRGSGGTTDEHGYLLVLYENDEVRLMSYDSGTGVSIDTKTTTALGISNFTANNYLWIRFRVDGDNLRYKIWHHGDAEPVSWDVDVTDTIATVAAGTGISCWDSTPTPKIDYIGIGTGGITVPMPNLSSLDAVKRRRTMTVSIG